MLNGACASSSAFFVAVVLVCTRLWNPTDIFLEQQTTSSFEVGKGTQYTI